MTRTLKGLAALFAVGLFMSMSVAAAQATPVFTAGSYPATVQAGTGSIVIGTDGQTIKCMNSNFDGSLKEASSTLVLQPFYANCDVWGFIQYSINTQGCTYVLHATEKQSADQYKAHFGISCPGGGILFSAGTCALEIPPQEGLTTVQIGDDTGAPNRATATFEVSSLAYTVTKDGFLCPLKSVGAKTDGTITSEAVLLKAFNASKTTEEVGLAVSGE